MRVRELIEALKAQDPDLEVRFESPSESGGSICGSIESVVLRPPPPPIVVIVGPPRKKPTMLGTPGERGHK